MADVNFFKMLKPQAKLAPKPETMLPWVEKYRPKTVDDVAYQDEVIRTLKASLQSGNLPHLLFYGPPGTGKTSTILAVSRDLFGHDYFRSRVLELNASDERGIAVIREKVKNFAQATAAEIPSRGSHSVPPFKIIILDEADSLTVDAQAALRRTMETYSRFTRFCIICNYVSRIIEPVASRCAKFRFRALESDTMQARLRHICDAERLTCSDSTLLELSRCADGDMRKAITFLQSAARLHGSNVDSKAVIDVAGVIDHTISASLLAACRSGSFDTLQRAVTDVIYAGYSASQVLAQLNEVLLTASDIPDTNKALIGWEVAKADKALVDGADEFLQVLNLCSCVMLQLLRTGAQPTPME